MSQVRSILVSSVKNTTDHIMKFFLNTVNYNKTCDFIIIMHERKEGK